MRCRRSGRADALSPLTSGSPECPTDCAPAPASPQPERASSGHRRRRIFSRVGRGAAGRCGSAATKRRCAKGTGHRAQGTGHRAQGKGQRAKGEGQRAKGEGAAPGLALPRPTAKFQRPLAPGIETRSRRRRCRPGRPGSPGVARGRPGSPGVALMSRVGPARSGARFREAGTRTAPSAPRSFPPWWRATAFVPSAALPASPSIRCQNCWWTSLPPARAPTMRLCRT